MDWGRLCVTCGCCCCCFCRWGIFRDYSTEPPEAIPNGKLPPPPPAHLLAPQHPPTPSVHGVLHEGCVVVGGWSSLLAVATCTLRFGTLKITRAPPPHALTPLDNTPACKQRWHAALAVHMVGNTDGCRWLDDGADQELIYFEGVIAGDFNHPATQFKFMGSVSCFF